MHGRTAKSQDGGAQAAARSAAPARKEGEAVAGIGDMRAEAAAQRSAQETADNSPRVRQLRVLQEVANAEPAERATLQAAGGVAVLQKTAWMWDGSKWVKQPGGEGEETPAPARPGKYKQEYVDTAEAEAEEEQEEEEEEEAADPYAGKFTLENGTVIDFDALNIVMNGVEIGTQVDSSVWRKMRQNLSEAITLPNKSHPAHGSNFDKKQRPEQQIKDWANVISGGLKEKLTSYFHDKWDVDL